MTVPDETARIARAAFPKGNPYLRLRDELGVLYRDELFADLFASQGQPALSPGMLALVLVVQQIEGYSDRQVAEAVRSRLDLKYLLNLPLEDAGFEASVLSEFRRRLLAGSQEERLLAHLLWVCQERGWLKAGGRQRTDSTHVLAAVRPLNRLELVVETLGTALEVLAAVAPGWVSHHLDASWFDRYGAVLAPERWPQPPGEQQGVAEQVGRDGFALLAALYQTEWAWLSQTPALETLCLVWRQQYYRQVDETGEQVRWRTAREGLPPHHHLIQTPYDVEARSSEQRSLRWLGYKLHLTEQYTLPGDPPAPHLVVDVQTTPSTQPVRPALVPIQAKLAARGLLPAEQLVDSGYLSAPNLLHSQALGIDLVGKAPADGSWQARQSPAYAQAQFAVDWAQARVTCPQGKVSRVWSKATGRKGQPELQVRFAKQDCLACPVRSQCVRSQTAPRTLKLQAQLAYGAWTQARQRQATVSFWQRYRSRSGIEGTISQAVRAFGLRRTRYLGLDKTHLHHLLLTVGLNLMRLARYLAGAPPSRTRHSRFLALASSPCT
jgi:transposase